MPDIITRATAYKLRIGDVLRGNPIIENERLKFLELGNKQIIRVNVVANVVERYEQGGANTFTSPSEIESTSGGESRKKYLVLTIDDASGQIRIKAFSDDVDKFKDIAQGNTVMVIGFVRTYNNELYIQPEIIKIQDPRYLLVRKLELEKNMPVEAKKEEILQVKDQIIDMIKKSEAEGGIDVDKIIMELKSSSTEIINQEIQKLLEEGLAFEPRPGKNKIPRIAIFQDINSF